jgi:hypothetical protein
LWIISLFCKFHIECIVYFRLLIPSFISFFPSLIL